MEISTDPDGTVYIRWCDGGPFTVVDPESIANITEHGLGGKTQWFSDDSDSEFEAARHRAWLAAQRPTAPTDQEAATS